MKWLITIMVVAEVVKITFADNEDPQYPIGDVRNCPVVSPITGQPLYRMEVLPGLGFDNLRNTDMNQVVQYNYSLCKTTNDGRFLIPDDMITVPIQKSWAESFAEYFDHWDDYTSSTSSSLNIEGFSEFSLINGKFSGEYQHVKHQQVQYKSKTTRTQLRNTLYQVMLETDAPLHPKFKSRLLDIAANIQDNNTEYAAYLSELLVRDYGTHIVRNVEAGGLLLQLDSINSSYVTKHTDSIIQLTGLASSVFVCYTFHIFHIFTFHIHCDVGADVNINWQGHDISGYMSNRSQSIIQTIGGPSYSANMTFDRWQSGLLDLLAPIDRSGDPLHYLITSSSIPELPTPLLNQLTDTIYSAVNRYYTVNTIYGCTDPQYSNFDYYANLDDGSCGQATPTNFSFGGVYQTCKIDPNNDYEDLCAKGGATTNPLTGDYSCPSGYRAVELHSGTITHATHKEFCDEHCTNYVIFNKCYCLSAWENVVSSATYQAYWCVADGQLPDRYMFGGTYTSSNVNPNTGSMTCPSHFIPLRIGQDLQVCISNDNKASSYSKPFGGFFSCNAANPLSTTKGRSVGASQCPTTYQNVLAAVYEGCEIHYCTQVKNTKFGKPPAPKLPPFHSKPSPKATMSQSMVIEGPYGELWLRDAQGAWHKHVDQPVVTGKDVLKHFTDEEEPSNAADSHDATTPTQSSGSGVSATVSAAISSVVTLVVCGLVIAAIFGIHRIVKKKTKKESATYTSIEDDGNTE